MNVVRSRPSPVAFAIGVGLVLCGGTIAVHRYLASFEHGEGLAFGTWPWPQLWLFGGAFFFGALPVYVSARYRLVTPALVAVGIYGWALATSWSSLVDSAQSSGAGISPTVFEIGLGFWPMPLWIPIVAGAFEYGIRRVIVSGRFGATS